jgi:hypothetical protein
VKTLPGSLSIFEVNIISRTVQTIPANTARSP